VIFKFSLSLAVVIIIAFAQSSLVFATEARPRPAERARANETRAEDARRQEQQRQEQQRANAVRVAEQRAKESQSKQQNSPSQSNADLRRAIEKDGGMASARNLSNAGVSGGTKAEVTSPTVPNVKNQAGDGARSRTIVPGK
jgi:alpha-galactosidase/6-phospho-beta-glucosidase family protein